MSLHQFFRFSRCWFYTELDPNTQFCGVSVWCWDTLDTVSQTLLCVTSSVLWVLLLVSFSSFLSSCFRLLYAVLCVVLRSPGCPYVWPSTGPVWHQFFPFCVLSSWRFCSCRLTWSSESCEAAGRFCFWWKANIPLGFHQFFMCIFKLWMKYLCGKTKTTNINETSYFHCASDRKISSTSCFLMNRSHT